MFNIFCSAQDKVLPYIHTVSHPLKVWLGYYPADSFVGIVNCDSLPVHAPYITYFERSSTKGYRRIYLIATENKPVQLIINRKSETAIPPTVKAPSLQIHGNILYDLNYRSYIDTPYNERNIYQHTIQTYLDITLKGQYPFRVYFTNRFSNSSFFKNFNDINFLYNSNDFSNKVKKQLNQIVQQRINEMDSAMLLKKILDSKTKEYTGLQSWIRNPAVLQKLVEEKENQWLSTKRTLSTGNNGLRNSLADSVLQTAVKQGLIKSRSNVYENIPGTGKNDSLARKYLFPSKDSLTTHPILKSLRAPDSLKVDSTNALQLQYAAKKKKLDSLAAEIGRLGQLYERLKVLQHINANKEKKEIEDISSLEALENKMKELHIADSTLPHGYKTLFALKSFGIGRTIADYSELSAKNISVTGIQAEYNPHYYYAVAAGYVDYRFRDYIVQSAQQQQKQYMALFRIGKGTKEGNHIFLTYYTGERQLYNSSTSAFQGTTIPNYSLTGFTLEGRYKINRSSYIVAEIAKSSLPYYSLDSSKKINLLASIFRANDRTNEAYAVQFVSLLSTTQTKINGTFRVIGSNFQSFSVFTSGASQIAWSAKLEQQFFKKRLNITGSVRMNDFTNPLITAAYKSNTVFKSLQATLRMKKWPVVSIGYFPSSQLTKLSSNQITENLFYTFVANASHMYHYRQTMMNTSLVFTRFYNRATDSNFVYFNTSNFLVSQSFFIGRLNEQLNLSIAVNTDYRLYVIEDNVQYRLNQWLSLGGGMKYNRQTQFNSVHWGWMGNAMLKLKGIGDFQLMMDDGFIPGANKTLTENKVGRLTYFRIF